MAQQDGTFVQNSSCNILRSEVSVFIFTGDMTAYERWRK